MLGIKLFIVLLYLIYLADAQYRRTPLRPDKPELMQSPSYSNVREIKADSVPLATPTGSILEPSRPETDFTTANTGLPIVNPRRPPPRFILNKPFFRPNKSRSPKKTDLILNPPSPSEKYIVEPDFHPSEAIPETETATILKPESNALSKDEETKKRNPDTNPAPKLKSEAEPISTLKSEIEDGLELQPKLVTDADIEPQPELVEEPVTLKEEVPKFRSRSPFSEPIPEPESKPQPEAKSELDSEIVGKHVPELKARVEAEIEPGAERQSEPRPKPEPVPESIPVTNQKNSSTATVKPDTDAVCKVKNAYYAIKHSCDTFIECQKYVANKRTCPDGLLFDRKIKWPRYPCGYPSEVDCGINTTTHTPKFNGECPRRFGSFAVHDGDCGKYIVCNDGHSVLMNCPIGLAFNSQIGACDWPENVADCNPKVFKDFNCPEPPIDTRVKLSENAYNYRYKNNCKDYVACIKGQPRLLKCDSGLSFDQITGRCITSDAVKNCKSDSKITDTKLYISRA